MKRVRATAAIGAALLAAASSEASAWVSLAAGAGSSGYGRDPYYVQDAKCRIASGGSRREVRSPAEHSNQTLMR